MEQRLQRVLAAAGAGSRRSCEVLIASGRVAVNGTIVTELGTRADPDKDVITLDGKPIGPAQEHVYVLLNKPVGYTSTRSDPHAEKTVLELVQDVDAFLYPVGRLDVDTSGLLILTNDGEFTNALAHPSHEVEKTYVAVVQGRIPEGALRALERGVKLEDGWTAPARARLLRYRPGRAKLPLSLGSAGALRLRSGQASPSHVGESTVELVIHEGRKRQVRRMLAEVGWPVLRLARTRIGDLELGELKEGEYRLLTKREVARLAKLAQRPQSG